MNQAPQSTEPRTAPFMAVAVAVAIVLIAVFHFAGFHFVIAAGAGR